MLTIRTSTVRGSTVDCQIRARSSNGRRRNGWKVAMTAVAMEALLAPAALWLERESGTRQKRYSTTGEGSRLVGSVFVVDAKI